MKTALKKKKKKREKRDEVEEVVVKDEVFGRKDEEDKEAN